MILPIMQRYGNARIGDRERFKKTRRAAAGRPPC